MTVIHSERLGTLGKDKVLAEIVSNPGGKYGARIVEQGRSKNVPMDASGLPNKELAWDMLNIFKEGYLRSQREDPKSNFVAEEKLV